MSTAKVKSIGSASEASEPSFLIGLTARLASLACLVAIRGRFPVIHHISAIILRIETGGLDEEPAPSEGGVAVGIVRVIGCCNRV